MWRGEDFNENGEAVRLYQPILYGKKPTQEDPTCSFIGGRPSTPVLCSVCRDPLYLLVQLYIPSQSSQFSNNRTLQLFCCNRTACTEALFASKENGKLVDGSGVVVCKRTVTEESQVIAKKEPVKSEEWTDDNEWIVEAGDPEGETMQSLEAKLAEMETNQTKPKTTAVADKKIQRTIESNNAFPCFLIHSQQEPPAMRPVEDEDDVGMTGSDDKIQKMLEKYMMEEDDEEILTALRGSVGGGSGGGRGGEKDERLSAADRALLTFSDRLKRSPRQVLRYAYNGVPLWSIPVESSTSTENKKHVPQRAKAKKQSAAQIKNMEPSIPACRCGAPRVFEVQILPSLLHVLEVDKALPGDDLGSLYKNGMNWGNICIYSCSKSCQQSDAEFVVVQESVDEKPAEFRQGMQDVVIKEDSQFVDDDDDDDAEGDESDEEMDEDEC